MSDALTARAAIEWRKDRDAGALRHRGEQAGQQDELRFKLEHFCDVELPTGGEWLLKGVIPREGVGTLFGESGHYKSFSAIDLAWHIAAGAPWCGRRVAAAPVVYLAAEAPQGVRKRLAGARLMHGLTETRPPVYVVGATPNLGTENGDLAKIIADIEAQDVRPGLIVLDTLSASIGGGDENGPGMTQLLANCQRLAQHFGAFVLIVCHVGHNGEKRERGHSSLMGNVDTRIHCEKPGALSAMLKCVKVKDGPDGLAFALKLEEWTFGLDQDGDRVTTLVVASAEEVEAAPVQKRGQAIPPKERLLLETVELALLEAGEDFHVPDGPKVKAVAEAAVRDRFYRRLAEEADPDETREQLAERRRKTLRRALNGAIQAKRLIAYNRFGTRLIWLP